MSVLYVTEPHEETGMVAAITDEPCPCGWPETVLHIWPDGTTKRGCPSCEVETDVPEAESPSAPACPECRSGKHGACAGFSFDADDAEVPCPCGARGHDG